MRRIAISKNYLDYEKELILSSVADDDKVLFFDNEKDFLESKECENVEVVFGEPEYSTIRCMKKLRWIQMTWVGAVLDVTEPEPLPEKHPLRHMEKVVLTPHISGISWGEISLPEREF